MNHEDTAYHAPIDVDSVPFRFASGPGRTPRRRGLFHVGWVVVGLVIVVSGLVMFVATSGVWK